MPKPKERVAPPPTKDGWDFRFATSDVVKGWEQICSAASANARVAWERITTEPQRVDTRQHRLKSSLGTRAVNGSDIEQWQYEVTAGATIDELAQQAPLVRFAEFTVVTVGALRSVGVRLEPTGRNRRHFTVILDDLDAGIEALLSCRHQVWINPYHED